MECIIGYISALEYWRSMGHPSIGTYPVRRSATHRAQAVLIAEEKPYVVESNRMLSACRSPLHVLVADRKARSRASEVLTHFWKEPLPECSVEEVAGRTFVSTPEFCFLQMANELSLVQLIRLGFELCGTYRLQGSSQAERRSIPLTSVEKLKKFIEKSAGRKGRVLAARALRYVLNGSASPMETVLAMLLCLPPKLGGYGIQPAQLNMRIEIPRRSERLASQMYCEGDLCWSEYKLCLEYDSKLYHLSPQRQHRDAVRRNTLISLGYTVVTVSSKQVFDREEFNRLAQQVARLTKRQLRLHEVEFAHKHCELREEILRGSHERRQTNG